MRLGPERRQIRPTVEAGGPSARPSSDATNASRSQAATPTSQQTSSACSALTLAGRPRRGSSTSPSRRSPRNRRRHFTTVGCGIPSAARPPIRSALRDASAIREHRPAPARTGADAPTARAARARHRSTRAQRAGIRFSPYTRLPTYLRLRRGTLESSASIRGRARRRRRRRSSPSRRCGRTGRQIKKRIVVHRVLLREGVPRPCWSEQPCALGLRLLRRVLDQRPRARMSPWRHGNT